jgi:FkbM family methyltransferase
VDAGGYHPLDRNNTYLLYKKNWRGINIDLSEFSIDLFNFIRPKDININVAVSNSDESVTFYYQKELSQLSTIKKNIANQRMQGLIKEKKIKSNKLTTILNNSKFNKRKIDFLNTDVEGADFDALKSLDFKIYRPKLICVEIYDENIEQSEIYIFLKKLNYTKKWSATFSHLFTDDFYKF